jgi:carbon starvation protein CstA
MTYHYLWEYFLVAGVVLAGMALWLIQVIRRRK